MKVSILSQYNANMFPALHFVAVSLAAGGAEVQFISRDEPTVTGVSDPRVTWVEVQKVDGPASWIPGIRSNYHGIVRRLARFRPDWIIGQHEYLVPALAYQVIRGAKAVKVAGYFCDYYRGKMGMTLIGRLSHRLDAYVDVCQLRLEWRQLDWPRIRATPFVIRQAPFRQQAGVPRPHAGMARIVHTGSSNALRLNRDRLSRFITRLCRNGVAVDWYMSGSSGLQAGDDVRASAAGLTDHPLFRLREPVEKAHLLEALSDYDAGLFWAPMAERDSNRSYFLSSASNKIGEYIAAGLVVAHTGNPGLSYLPEEVCAVFDPTDPEAGADQLAAALSDRAAVERKRRAALRYHLEEMNFETQAAPFIRHVLGAPAPTRTALRHGAT